MAKCKAKVETYSRIVGYFRPVQQWNDGMREQFKDRKMFDLKKAVSATVQPSSSGENDGVTKD